MRALVLALAVMLVVPTIGRSGAEDVPSTATTAAMAAADAHGAPDADPAAAAEEAVDPDAADAPAAADRDVAASAEVRQAPAPDQPKAPATPDAPATAEAPARATADAPAQAKADNGKAQAADAPKKKAAAAKKGGQGKQAAAAPPARQPAKARTAAAASGSVRSLYLAIGHGRAPDGTWQPGAEDPRTGMFEVDANRIMVEAMRQVFDGAPNLEVHFEGGNNHPNMVGSVARANQLGVDDCIEIHQDTAAAPPGAFVHWYTGANDAKRLADRIVTSVRNQGVPTRWDWHRERPGLYFLRKSDCRAVLVEVGRVGDYDAGELQQLGRAMARAYLADTAKMRGVAAG